MSVNRGKESIALDLKNADDLAIFHRLLARADVLVENFRPGVMEKLGLGWDDAARALPEADLRGDVGLRPHAGRTQSYAAYDLVAQAMGGVMSLTGHPGSAADARRHLDRRHRAPASSRRSASTPRSSTALRPARP